MRKLSRLIVVIAVIAALIFGLGFGMMSKADSSHPTKAPVAHHAISVHHGMAAHHAIMSRHRIVPRHRWTWHRPVKKPFRLGPHVRGGVPGPGPPGGPGT